MTSAQQPSVHALLIEHLGEWKPEVYFLGSPSRVGSGTGSASRMALTQIVGGKEKGKRRKMQQGRADRAGLSAKTIKKLASKRASTIGTCHAPTPTLPSPPHAPTSSSQALPSCSPSLASAALWPLLCCQPHPHPCRARLAPSQARRTSRAAPHALITARQLVRIGPCMPSHTPVPHPPTPSHAIPVPLPCHVGRDRLFRRPRGRQEQRNQGQQVCWRQQGAAPIQQQRLGHSPSLRRP